MNEMKPDDIITREGLRIERFGKNIFVDIRPTKRQQRKAKKIIKKMRKILPKRIEKAARQLEAKLQDFFPIDVVSSISFLNLFGDPETFKEFSHEGNPAVVEYLTLLILKKPIWRGKKFFIEAKDLEEIQSITENILEDTMNYYASEHISLGEPAEESTLEKFRYRAKTYELVCRNPGYPHHLILTLKGIFSDPGINPWIKENLGFQIEDVIEFSQMIAKLMQDKIHVRQDKAIDYKNQIMNELDQSRKGMWHNGKCPEELLRDLSNRQEEEALKTINNLCAMWTFFALGDTFSFTYKDLAELAIKPTDCAESFLRYFSLEFGAVPHDFFMPSPTHLLKLKPIIHYDDRYICLVPHLILWSIRPQLENLINPTSGISINKDQRVWEKYQAIRSEYVEKMAFELFQKALNPNECYRKLFYPIKKNGKVETGELDGIVILDNGLFLIECKSGCLTDPSKRGAPRRIESDLKKLLADSHNQALRAKGYITAEKEPIFRLKDGTEVKVDKSKIDKIFMVTVNLEPLDVYTPVLYEVAKLGIFGSSDYPWAISLLDLFVISELVEFPSQFVHFVLRRLRINELAKIEANDELDWFGHYLTDGLYFEDIEKQGVNFVNLLTYTTSMDDYYFYITGQRTTPAPKPAQSMPQLFKEIISELEKCRPQNYLDISCSLLDISGKDRIKICELIEKMNEKAKKDKKVHDMSLFFKNGETIITYMCGEKISRDDLGNRLCSYGLLKKYQMKSKLWIGLGSTLSSKKRIDCWKIKKGDWKHDERLERLVNAHLPMMTPEEMDKHLNKKP
jgi:hypothetical protein